MRYLARSIDGSSDVSVERTTTRCIARLYARTKNLPTFGVSQQCENGTYLRYLPPNVSVFVIATYLDLVRTHTDVLGVTVTSDGRNDRSVALSILVFAE
jgi:hypothetical protein